MASSTEGSGEADELARSLAQRHMEMADGVRDRSVDRQQSLLNFSEVTYAGGWSLRSALCRFAQPEPVRVGRALESIRRLEAVVQAMQRPLERHPAWSLRPQRASSIADDGQAGYCDVRTADIARLIESGLDTNTVIGGYEAVSDREPLTDSERAALGCLTVTVRAEQLADVMTQWANQGPANRPVEAFDSACDEVEARLDELGVPRESTPPRGPRPSR